MQGKKVRENPLLEGLNSGNDGEGASAVNVGAIGGFGSQQQFQLKAYYGEAARAKEEEEGEEENKKEQPKKVRS